MTIDEVFFKSHSPLANPLPTIKELCHATKASVRPTEEIPFSLDGLTHFHIQEFKQKLFFIKFTPVSTLIPIWYLVQV